MPTRSENPPSRTRPGRRWIPPLLSGLLTIAGCGGEPSRREVENARAFEALLTAVSLKNRTELEQDARRIEERHDSGEISDAAYRELSEIIAKARAGDWNAAEARAYGFRKPFGDRGAYFR